MATELATAYVALIPSLRGAAGNITKEFRGVGSSGGTEAGHGFRSTFGQIVGGTFVGQLLGDAFRGATRFVADSIREAMVATAKWGEITAQTGAVIKSTGAGAGITAGQIHDLAQSLEAQTATSAESIQSGANLLLTFRSLKNGVGEGNDVFNQATVALVDMARALGKDPQDAAIQLGKALNDPITGMTALRRVGVSFTQDQQKLIRTLAESGDIMGAQKVILGELTAEFGGSGAAFASTFTGRLLLMKDAWHDISEELLAGVQPGLGKVFTALTLVFNKLLDSGAVTTFSEKLSHLGEGAADKLTIFANKITDIMNASKGQGFQGFVDAVSKSSPAFAVFSGVLGSLQPIMPQIVKAVRDLQPSFTDLLKAVIPILPPLVKLALEILPPLVKLVTLLTPAVVALAVALKPVGTAVGDGLKHWTDWGQILSAIASNNMPAFRKAMAETDSTTRNGVNGIIISSLKLKDLGSSLGEPWIRGAQQISGAVGTIVGKFQVGAGQIGGAAGQIGSFVNTAMGTVGQALSRGVQSMGSFTATILQKFSQGSAQIGSFASSAGSHISSFISTLGSQFARGSGQIGSFISGMGAQFAKGAGQVGSFASSAGGHISSFIGTLGSQFARGAGQIGSFVGSVASGMGRVVGAVGSAMGQMGGAIASGVSNAVGIIAGLPGRAAGAIGNLGGLLVSAGRSLVEGFASGIRSAIGAVTSAAGSVLGAVANMLPHSPAKTGPFSGSGWTAVKESGGALFDQFVSGMAPDLTEVLSLRFAEASESFQPNVSGFSTLVPAHAPSAAPAFPRTVVLRDADGTFLGRMRTEAQGVVNKQATWDDIQSRGGTIR